MPSIRLSHAGWLDQVACVLHVEEGSGEATDHSVPYNTLQEWVDRIGDNWHTMQYAHVWPRVRCILCPTLLMNAWLFRDSTR